MDAAKPSLDLLRSLTDEHVLRALMEYRRLTRAELATRTGISKPTISESVRRLEAAGLVVDTGERTTGRGRVGSYFGLAPDLGCAMVLSVAPEGVAAETIDAHGDVAARATEHVARPAPPAEVERAIRAAIRGAQRDQARRTRIAVVSAADPVDRATGRLVHLPDAPFLLGELSPVDLLADVVDGPVLVDNDVNWAARAELTREPRDFVYVYLGEGVGAAVVSDGEVRRGHGGLAGEIAHVPTVGPEGMAMPLTEVFAALGLRRPGSTAIDVPKLLLAEEHGALGRAVAGVLSAAVALADPAVVLIGGAWGRDPRVLAAIQAAFASAPRHVPVEAASVEHEPALTGARTAALEQLRDAVVASPR